MTALRKTAELLTEADYLAGEAVAETRHEYANGAVEAMAGASAAHNQLAVRLVSALEPRLRGQTCQVFMADVKLRLGFLNNTSFYYPDVMVACDDPPPHSHYREQPVILVEILSPSTFEKDTREKLYAYVTIPTLRHYLMVHQDGIRVDHVRKDGAGEWTQVSLTAVGDTISLPEIGAELTVGELYEGIALDALAKP